DSLGSVPSQLPTPGLVRSRPPVSQTVRIHRPCPVDSSTVRVHQKLNCALRVMLRLLCAALAPKVNWLIPESEFDVPNKGEVRLPIGVPLFVRLKRFAANTLIVSL